MAALKLKQKDSDSAEAAEPKQINIAPPPKKRKGFGKGGFSNGAKSGCRIVFLLFIVVILAFVGAIVAFRTFCTSPMPGNVRNYRPSPPLTEQALKRVKALRTAATVNGIITVYFTERELNALLQKNVEEIDWKGQADISLDDNLSFAYTLPLTGIPGFKGRHVTGQMALVFNSGDEGLKIALADGTTLNGYKIPGFIRKIFDGGSFTTKVLSAPGFNDLVEHLGKIEVENKQLAVTTRKKKPEANK